MGTSLSISQPSHSLEEMREVNPDPLFTVDQAAAYLNVKTSFIRDLTKQRRMSRHKIGGNLRIRRSECDRLIREGAVLATRPLNTSRFD